jgi:hypothetical protein
MLMFGQLNFKLDGIERATMLEKWLIGDVVLTEHLHLNLCLGLPNLSALISCGIHVLD